MLSIKEIRELTGLSQSKFAKKYHLSPSTLKKWEQGQRPTPIWYLWLLNENIKYEGYFYDKKDKDDLTNALLKRINQKD